MSILQFKKKEKIGIVENGKVTIRPDGTILVEEFSFNGVDMATAQEMARSWALKCLRKA